MVQQLVRATVTRNRYNQMQIRGVGDYFSGVIQIATFQFTPVASLHIQSDYIHFKLCGTIYFDKDGYEYGKFPVHSRNLFVGKKKIRN